MSNSRDTKDIFKVSYFVYRLKKVISKTLKGIHNLFYIIGIDIRLRKKDTPYTAIEHNSQTEVNKYYSSSDKQYEIKSAAHQKFFLEIIKKLKSENIDLNDKIIADFGCGMGNLIYHINENFTPAENFGFDFSETILALAIKRFPEGKFQQHDLYNEVNQVFDFVFCTEVIEHLLFPDKALQNILKTVNKNGGGLLVTVPDGRKDTFSGHINFWSPESWEVFIKSQVTGTNDIKAGYITSDCLYALIKF